MALSTSSVLYTHHCLVQNVFITPKGNLFLIKQSLPTPSSPQPFSSVLSLLHVRLFAISWTAAHQAFLSIANSQSPPKPMSIKSVMPSNHLILCHSLLLLPSIFPSVRVFSNELRRFSHVRLFVTPWTVARQTPPSVGFSRQEY